MPFQSKQGFYTSGNLNYHAGYKPTAADIGIASSSQATSGSDNTTIMTPLRVKEYVASLGLSSTEHNHDSSYLKLTGGTLTGSLITSNTTKDSRLTTGNQQIFNAGTSIIIMGNPSTPLQLESNVNPNVKIGSTVHTMYHTGNKPTPADIGAAASSHTHTMTMWTINKQITVNGDANTYYPVVIDVGLMPTTIEIYRGYAWTAPPTWNTATHKGAVQLRWTTCDGEWGGTKVHRHEFFTQQYSKQVADVQTVAHGYKTTVWLRGGGATYQYRCTENVQPTIYYERTLIYDDSRGDQYDVWIEPRTTVVEPYNTYWQGAIDYTEPVLDNGQRVYSPHNKPSLSTLGAAAASHTHPVSQVTGLATVATSGSYNDLSNKPVIVNDAVTNTTQSWSSKKVDDTITSRINNLVNSAPGALDTLKELADSLGNDPNFATTVTNKLALKAEKTYVDTELAKKSNTHDHPYAPTTHTHSYIPLSGGTVTSDITFSNSATGLKWTMNTDGAAIRFKNTGDGDADSYLEFNTSDNGNEYFKWTHTSSSSSANGEWMSLKNDGLRIKGNLVYHAGNKPTLSDLGAASASHTHNYLPLSGGSLTGTLNITRTAGEILKLTGTNASSNDMWITLGNYDAEASAGTYRWFIKYVGSTDGAGGNEFRIESASSGKFFQMDHDGNLELNTGTAAAPSLQRLYHTGFKPSAADIGAAATSHTHSNYSLTTHTHDYAAAGHNHDTVYQKKESTTFLLNGNYVSVRTPGRTAAQYYEFWDSNIGWATIKAQEVYAGDGQHKVYHAGNKPTAADIGAAPTSHSHSYLPISGGTMTGSITLPADKYWTNSVCGIDMKNSDLVGVNRIYFNDESDSVHEGIKFLKSGKTLGSKVDADYDTIRSYQSVLYYNTNRVYHQGYKPTAADIGAAATSHGNHVPATQTANNAIFLRNDNTWQTITAANIGAAASSHTHNYLPLTGGTVTGNLIMNSATAKIQLGTGALTTIGVENTYDVVIKSISDIILHAETDGNTTAEFVQLKAGNAGSQGLKVFTDRIEAHEKIVAKKQIDMGSSSQAGIKYNEETECIEFYFA